VAHSIDESIEFGGNNGVGKGSATSSAPTTLLDADFLAKLERISMVVKRSHPGRAAKGDKTRAIRRTGTGKSAQETRAAMNADFGPLGLPEFPESMPPTADADREYRAAAVRLERLFRKLFVVHDDLSIHFLVDASQTMGFAGAPGHSTKFAYARKMAAALGYVALARYGRVGVRVLGHARGRRGPILRSREDSNRFFGYLQHVAPGGYRDFTHAVLSYAHRIASEPGVCIILSDFLNPHWERAIRALLARQFRVVLIHILDSDAVEPAFLEELRLVDGDTRESRQAGVAPQIAARYRKALDRFRLQLSRAAYRSGMEYIGLTTDVPFEPALLRTLRTARLLR